MITKTIRSHSGSAAKPHDKQKGATLLEILVTIVILALGLLGIAGMNLVSLKDANLGYQYTIASLQTQDIAERISANRIGMTYYGDQDWWAGGTAPDSCSLSCEEDEEGETSCNDACTPEELALDDFWQWNLNNRRALPTGNGRIVADGDDLIIAIRWSDPRLNGEDGWDGTVGTDTGTACGEPGDNLRCFALRYRP